MEKRKCLKFLVHALQMFILFQETCVVKSRKATTEHHDKLRSDVGNRTHCLCGSDPEIDEMNLPFSFLLLLRKVSLSSLDKYQRSDMCAKHLIVRKFQLTIPTYCARQYVEAWCPTSITFP
jgi:hypothetical protein